MARWPAGPMWRRRRFAPQRPRPAGKAPTDDARAESAALDAELKRIDEIIRNARATWFALLAAQVFAGITLASVRDVAFFVTSERTQLPLVNISVPVNSFFMAGSLLIAAFYIHFHIYLERLWQALGAAPARIGGKPLADCLHPWVVADAALRIRDRLRPGEEQASAPRSLAAIGNVAAIVLVWLFGLQIVGWFWWRSMPAHDPLMTGWIAIVLVATLGVFLRSGTAAHACLANRSAGRRWWAVFVPAVLAIIGLTVVRTWLDPWEGEKRETVVSLFQCPADEAPPDEAAAASSSEEDTEERFCWTGFDILLDFLRPAPANLREVVFTEKPRDWLGLKIAETEFRVRWCKEIRGLTCANPLAVWDGALPTDEEKTFQREWTQRRTALLAAMPKPDLRGKDLRGADLSSARLEGANLSEARLEGANLSEARLEGANLSSARLEDANLSSATLDGADLSRATLEGADLIIASLEGANLAYSKLDNANLRSTRLKDANLGGASLVAANLFNARLEGANLANTNFDNANLHWARLELVTFYGATLDNANLMNARIFGTDSQPIQFNLSEVNSSNWSFAALRNVHVKGAAESDILGIDTSFADGSVVFPEEFIRPCQWADKVLTDNEYFGRWRGWRRLHQGWTSDLQEFSFVQPPLGCGPLLPTKGVPLDAE